MVTMSIADNGTPPAPDGVNSSCNFDGIHMDKFAQLAVWHEAYVSSNPCATQLTKALFSNCPFYPLLRLWAPFRIDDSIHQDLLTWLEHTTSFNQTLDRDIVFALVSLSSANDQHKIIPDYESPDDYLFRRIFNYLVRHPRSPGVLQPFVLSTKPRTFDLPSWCQAYWPSKPHLHPTMRFKGTEPRPFKACGGRVNTANSTSTPITADALLPVHGSPFDEIALVVPTNLTPSSASDSPLRTAIMTCDQFFSQSTHADPYRGTGSRLMALCMTLTGGNTDGNPENEWWRIFKVWLNTGIGNIRQLPSRHVDGRQIQPFRTPLGRQRVRKGYLDMGGVRGASKRDDFDPFFKVARDYCSNRCLVVTKRGYVGLAPLGTKVGDQVAILYGEDVPGVLRRQGGDVGQIYSVIGATYVHGIMYGEALESQGGTNEVQYLLR